MTPSGKNKAANEGNDTSEKHGSPGNAGSVVTEYPQVEEPLEWEANDPPFLVPEWESFGCAKISPHQMSRHTLILGETGSGKTKSGIFPLVRAAVTYGQGEGRADLAPSMLIIDPKREIASFVRTIEAVANADREIRYCDIGTDDWTLWFFEGKDPQSLTADEYAQAVFAVSPAAEAERGANANNAFFTTQAESVVRQLMGVELFLWRNGGIARVEKFWGNLEQYIQQSTVLTGISMEYRTSNYLARFAAFVNASSLAQRAVLEGYVEVSNREGVPAPLTMMLGSLSRLADDTFSSIVATVNNRLGELASPDVARHVSMDPFTPPDAAKRLSVIEALDRGSVVCYYPQDTSMAANVIGQCLKSKFFELTFSRSNRTRPFVYVCDEFQRFITNDATSGEQSFLDRCRAYRAICVLATQSIASLQYALGRDGKAQGDEAALDILFNNTGTKLFFRNTDQLTQVRIRGLLPAAPSVGKLHISEVRPVSTLQVGECYYLLSDGRWGRRRVQLDAVAAD